MTFDFLITRVHSLVIMNMSAKFDEDTNNVLVYILYTKLKCYKCTHGVTEGTTEALLLYILFTRILTIYSKIQVTFSDL